MCYLIDTELFKDEVDLFKNKEEEDVWGILSDINDDHYLEESTW
jgi:hypothetical protein